MVNENSPINSIAEVVGAPRCTHVVAYTDENIYSGYIVHAITERFLDVLNRGSVVDPVEATSDFLRLTDVEIFTLDGVKQDVAENCLLNKFSTLAVAEKKIIGGELPPAKPFFFTLFQRKKPLSVKILLQHLTIFGQVYVGEQEQSVLSLDTELTFIPVTGATLIATLKSGPSDFDFMAVNKSQVTSILEVVNK